LETPLPASERDRYQQHGDPADDVRQNPGGPKQSRHYRRQYEDPAADHCVDDRGCESERPNAPNQPLVTSGF
jgi:hypothetical protein